jgi:predicted NBD/HSP70 family sugar kinase/biotin operon repressor
MQKFSMNNAVNASQQNQINLSLIFNYLRASGWKNRSRIAEDLGLSIPAVSRSMDTLEELGCIIKQVDDKGTTRKGTLVYSVNPDHGFVVAVDLLSIETATVVVDFAGRIRCAEKGFKPEESTDVVRDLIAVIDRCMERFVSTCGHPVERIRAISLGVPAVVNRSTGKLMLSYYEKYEAIDFREVLGTHYGVPVLMENISSLSALGEQEYGESSPGENVVLMEIGNGIGSGVLINGAVHRGNGFAGEIGFSLTNAEDIVLPSRRTGYLEKKASLSAVKLNVLHELSFGVESSLTAVYKRNASEITPHVIFQHALDGDRLCQMAITNMVRQISTALHNVVVILDPDAIIIGGDVCSMPGAKSLLITPIRERLEASLPFEPPGISLSSLGSRSGILGAATIAIESILLSEWPYHQRPASE